MNVESEEKWRDKGVKDSNRAEATWIVTETGGGFGGDIARHCADVMGQVLYDCRPRPCHNGSPTRVTYYHIMRFQWTHFSYFRHNNESPLRDVAHASLRCEYGTLLESLPIASYRGSHLSLSFRYRYRYSYRDLSCY